MALPPACTDNQKRAFVSAIQKSSSCNVPYDWTGPANPNENEFSELSSNCSFARNLSIPACYIMKTENGTAEKAITLYEHYNSVKTQCDCTEEENQKFADYLRAASSRCTGVTSAYQWPGYYLPNEHDHRELCSCSVEAFELPRCSWTKEGNRVSVLQHFRDAFNCTNKTTPNVTEVDYGIEVATPSVAPTSATPLVAPTLTPALPTSTTNKSSSNVGIIAGIAGGAVVVALIIGTVVGKYRRKRSQTAQHSPLTFQSMGDSPRNPGKETRVRSSGAPTVGTDSILDGTIRPSSLGALSNVRFTEGGKWDDPVIAAVRIPLDVIFVGSLLSRGGFGEVHRGTYRGETVAIKRLLPERRKDLTQIDNFLSEVKLMSALEHERIVKFIGVAWNSLSDVCMIVEFMEHGDLRSVLSRWDSAHRPDGFDADKIKIALHIAHALVYLHSLQPVVVHRDLKSKNVLLDGSFDAKLMDFGIARERADVTMTAGVGSSLWMAPEVMMGKRYDEKADIFSFGVVLSELDTHQLPYSHAKVSESGQKLPEAAILQQVMLGRLSVAFTDRGHPELVQLGRDCVRLDAKERPTTAQVLHRVHQILRQYTCLV